MEEDEDTLNGIPMQKTELTHTHTHTLATAIFRGTLH